MRLKGRVAVVTGGSRGIGRAVCERFLREGARVTAIARDAGALGKAVEAMSGLGEILGVPGDVSNRADVEGLVARTVEAFQGIDILVNNAALLGPLGDFTKATEEDWDAVMATNVKGTFLCSKAALPHMPRTGSIINVTSGLAQGPSPRYFPYSLSKWTVEGLTFAMARAVPQRVNAVDPGLVSTAMTDYTGAPPAKVMGVFAYLASDASRGVTGKVLDAGEYEGW